MGARHAPRARAGRIFIACAKFTALGTEPRCAVGWVLVQWPRSPEAYFAFIVGNDAYTSLPGLTRCARDAEALGRLVQSLGYPSENVEILTNATCDVTVRKYHDLLDRVAGAQDSTVLVYFSGHGAQLANDTGLVCPGDSEWDRGDGLRVSWLLRELVERAPLSAAVVFVDARREEVVLSSSGTVVEPHSVDSVSPALSHNPSNSGSDSGGPRSRSPARWVAVLHTVVMRAVPTH